jgi:hypothetical protein
VIQAVIDLQDKIQREGTIGGAEFETAFRQRGKRALVELPMYGRQRMNDQADNRFAAVPVTNTIPKS